MRSFFASLPCFVLIVHTLLCRDVTAAPAHPHPRPPSPPAGDPPFVTPDHLLVASLQCPRQPGGSYKGIKNPILLVPGTGTNGSEAYDRSQVPMTASLGYQPCYINPINHTQADIQISVEYLVRALQLLRAESSRKVPTIGGSQGNLIAQWAYAFYPSARQNALSHFSMAGDFKGTKLAPIAITTGLGTATPAVWQQNYGSHLVTALANAGGLNAQIPTTSVYSATDEILQPEGPTPETATSYLYGATNVRLQDVCGPAFVMGHVQHFTNSFVFKILQAHLASPTRMAQPASIRATDCSLLLASPPLTAEDKLHFQDANVFSQINANQPDTYKPRCEPLLRDYARIFDKTAPTTGC